MFKGEENQPVDTWLGYHKTCFSLTELFRKTKTPFEKAPPGTTKTATNFWQLVCNLSFLDRLSPQTEPHVQVYRIRVVSCSGTWCRRC
jgi:hypothetical protein